MALSWAAGAVDGWRRRRVAAPTTFYSANHHQCKVENRVDRTTLGCRQPSLLKSVLGVHSCDNFVAINF